MARTSRHPVPCPLSRQKRVTARVTGTFSAANRLTLDHTPPTDCATSGISAMIGLERVLHSSPGCRMQRYFHPFGQQKTGILNQPVKTPQHNNATRCATRGPFISKSKKEKRVRYDADISSEQVESGSIFVRTAVALLCWEGSSLAQRAKTRWVRWCEEFRPHRSVFLVNKVALDAPGTLNGNRGID